MSEANQVLTGAEAIEAALINPDNNNRELLVIKEKFLEEIYALRKPNKLEIRAINRVELNGLIQMLKNKDTKDKKYYYFVNHYRVSDGDNPQLIYIPKEVDAACTDGEKLDKTGKKHRIKDGADIPLVVVPLEEMFDACMGIHKSIGSTGRQGMEKEGAKFYSNFFKTGYS